MYTYLKDVNTNKFFNCQGFQFTDFVAPRGKNKHGGYKAGKYRNLWIRLYDSGRIVIFGSLHKFSNLGFHNQNTFDIEDLIDVILFITDELGIEPKKVRIAQLEFGLNLNLRDHGFDSLKSKQILQKLLIHKTKVFDIKTYKGEGRMHSVEREEYTVKLYDKAKKPRRLEYELLRYEIHASSSYLKSKRVNVNTLAELTLEETWEKLHGLLLDVWDEIVLAEIEDLSQLTLRQQQRLGDMYRKEYWELIVKEGKRMTVLDGQRFYKQVGINTANNHSKQLKALTSIHGKGLHVKIKSAIDKEISQLYESLLLPPIDSQLEAKYLKIFH